MKTRLTVALVVLASGIAAPTFAQPTIDPKTEQQIRVLASKYDSAINRHDADAIAALYTQDAVFWTHHDGSFHGRQTIEKEYVQWYFKRWNKHNYATTIARVTAVGNDVRATGTWTCDYSYGINDSHSDHGDVWWVIVREGDTWKIRKDTQTGTPWAAQ